MQKPGQVLYRFTVRTYWAAASVNEGSRHPAFSCCQGCSSQRCSLLCLTCFPLPFRPCTFCPVGAQAHHNGHFRNAVPCFRVCLAFLQPLCITMMDELQLPEPGWSMCVFAADNAAGYIRYAYPNLRQPSFRSTLPFFCTVQESYLYSALHVYGH